LISAGQKISLWESLRDKNLSAREKLIFPDFLDFCVTRAMQPSATLQPRKQVAEPLWQGLSATLQPIFQNS